MTLKRTFNNILRNQVVLPDHTQCPRCGFFDTNNPEVQARVAEKGKQLDQAACRCADRKAVTDRQDMERWGESNMPNRARGTVPKTFERLKSTPEIRPAHEAAQEMADMLGPRTLVLIGASGQGKSHLLEAIGRVWLHEGKKVRYELVPELLDRLRASYDSATEESLYASIQWLINVDLLLLDDLGLSRGTEWEHEKLTEIVDGRIRRGGWMAIGANHGQKEMETKIGFRLVSRLWSTEGKTISINGPDWRREGKK